MELVKTELYKDANLKAYYRLNNNSDSKNRFDLTNSGTVTYVPAKYGSGLQEVTANSYLYYPGSLGIANNTISICCWAKWIVVNGGLVWIQFADNDTTVYISYELGNVDFMRDKNGIVRQGYSYAVSPGTSSFHHYAITYDGINVRGYYDGALVGTTAASGSGNNGLTDNIRLPHAARGTTGNAILDDVCFFNKVLTLAEIQTLYIQGPSAGNFISSLL